ncbi:RidA family protein [Arthrobacter zhaoguopingii]|uniref:RidA family protein n=1 Tax=Arthrobacter zhaoguopingii TaxID=2681491 RepID=UPI0013595A0A|nr:RidA family protein [Arthrobacter zhaoguopingii]
MITKTNIEVPGLGDSRKYAYLQCVTAGDFAFVAGQTGVDKDYNIVSPEFGAQARQALRNVGLALEAAGTNLANIVNLTVYLADARDAFEFIDICHELMDENFAPTAILGGIDFVLSGLRIEIQATAVIERP